MSSRTILIHNYARKNKSRRKKYFILSMCSNYSEPRLDYFINEEKWNQKKHEIYNNSIENISYRSVNLTNLFFVDDIQRSKSKLVTLALFLEDRHLILTLPSQEIKKKWKEYFENIIYKNSKLKSICKIEHVLEVSIRLKPKDNIDKSVYSQLKGTFRACFTKSFLMFVNTSLEKPAFTIQYPFIRQWESRFDGTFRLEIGRAALIGECVLILQLADYEDSKAAHAMLTNCIMSFKLTKPDPPKIRNTNDKSSKRNSFTSDFSKPSSSINIAESMAKRHESCITFATESNVDQSYKGEVQAIEKEYIPSSDYNYVPMNGGRSIIDSSPNKSNNVLDYIEHINRIYKCPNCGCFTRLLIYCSKCCNTVNMNSLSLLCKPDLLGNSKSIELPEQLFEPTRSKAQSLTEKPNRFSSSFICKSKPFISDPNRSVVLNTSKSSSKTSTNDASCSSKQESLSSLSVSANRHDDDLFMELDFDNLESRISMNSKVTNTSRQKYQLKCVNCLMSLIHKSAGENLFDKRCSTCFEELVTLCIPLKDSIIASDWRPRTTSLLPTLRPKYGVVVNQNQNHNEYVDVKLHDNSTIVDR